MLAHEVLARLPSTHDRRRWMDSDGAGWVLAVGRLAADHDRTAGLHGPAQVDGDAVDDRDVVLARHRERLAGCEVLLEGLAVDVEKGFFGSVDVADRDRRAIEGC